MNQTERRIFLIRELLDEDRKYRNETIPESEERQKWMLRAMMNIRPAKDISDEFLRVQDEYLREVIREKGIVDVSLLPEIRKGISLWQGDITRVKADAIVNAANSGMTGCYSPCHSCIDNCIHTYAGVQLRRECASIMKKQGIPEATGRAKITPGYNLPSKYVIHTVGPIVSGAVTERDEKLLASCYRECLSCADDNGLDSIVFCCISTGVFSFPNQRAAEIAVETVEEWLEGETSVKKVVFNVFKDKDLKIYSSLLSR